MGLMNDSPVMNGSQATEKTFFISNSAHPCTEIALDANRIRHFYLANGWHETVNPAEADHLIVSTCAYNQQYEDAAINDVRQRAGQLKPGARLITTGCLPKINPDRLSHTAESTWVPPLELQRFDDLIEATQPIDQVPVHAVRLQEYEANPFFHRLVKVKSKLEGLRRRLGIDLIPHWMGTIPTPDWFFIRGSVGCLGQCTYCAVRRAKGGLISVPAEQIIRQTRAAVERGAKEISLAGDDMGAWGVDLDRDLADLLGEMVAVGEGFKINIRFVEPLYLMRVIDKITPIFATGRISAFCLPIQSGSNRILRRMGRGYTIEQVLDLVDRIAAIPQHPRLASIIMVGFPGETDDDFLASAALIDRLQVDMFQILPYEGRPGTPSVLLPDQVPDEVKRDRHDRLLRKFKLAKVVGLPTMLSSKLAGLPFPAVPLPQPAHPSDDHDGRSDPTGAP
jgi:threonylcarbamoyladenosine tRNA methylthiotransferase CDKAL1